MKGAHYHRRHLPHIYLDEAVYFITFRLKGSIPIYKLSELQSITDSKSNFRSGEKRYELDRLFFARYDELLDKNVSKISLLKQSRLAEIVKSSIHFYDSHDYILYCYCIMPNHVHVLFAQIENARTIDKIMQSIKRYSARHINKVLRREGSIWQSESYDHIVRSEKEFYRIISYIVNNPVKARLVDEWDEWPHTYVSKSIADL
jgi:REP element-mobilizing transposase RayT